MEQFLNISAHYPVAIFSVLVIVSIVYWLIACLGLVDMDSGVDIDVDLPDGGVDLDIPDGSLDLPDTYQVDGSGMQGTLAGLLLKLRLNGVPLPLVLSLVSILGWLISYFGVLLCFNFFGVGLLRWVLGTVILIAAFWLAIFLTSLIILPVRKMTMKTRAETVTSRSLVGCTATVRSPVNAQSGQVVYFDGGANHILPVHSHRKEQSFNKGDRVILVEYFPETNSYSIVSNDEFHGL